MQRRIKAGVGKTVEHFTIDIQEDELDWNYERLFKCMFADNFKTVIYQDPFIYDMHHVSPSLTPTPFLGLSNKFSRSAN